MPQLTQQKQKADNARARLEHILRDLQRKSREGWYGEYYVRFRAGEPFMVERRETKKPEEL